MTDNAASRISRLREQLKTSQTALVELNSRSTQEIKALTKLAMSLSQSCHGHNREFDNRLAEMRKYLKHDAGISSNIEQLKALEPILWDHSNKFDGKLRRLSESATAARQVLMKARNLPDSIRKQAKDQLAAEAPYGLDGHIAHIAKLLELYALALQTLQSNPTPADAGKSATQPDKRHQEICDELQRLIPELEFNGELGAKLAEIRLKLLLDISPEELPSLCLELIKLIKDGANAERRASHEFLSSLNESLGRFQEAYSGSLTDQAELIENQRKNSCNLRQQLQILDDSLVAQSDWGKLRQVVRQHVDQVSKLLARKEELEDRERALLERLEAHEADIRHIKRENEEYRRRLRVQQRDLQLDSLTQLHNRGALDERLGLEFKRWQRYGSDLAIAVIDIDLFKRINDRFGHTAGDNALKIVARTIQKMMRKTDFVARYGGEEFVMLLPQTSQEQLTQPLEKLRLAIKALPFTFKDERISITVSIGASLFKQGDEMMSAFERADQALYAAKNLGRNKVVINS